MKKENLKDGEYYYIIFSDSTFLLKQNSSRISSIYELRGTYINITANTMPILEEWGNISDAKEIRLATQQEINHLDACIRANKYVEPSKSMEINYEIF